jgi:hypothetical protein
MTGQHFNYDQWFAAANTVHISALALKRGTAFLEEIKVPKLGHNRILAFSWADTRRIRQRGTNIWSDLGPGFDVAVHDRGLIPPGRIGRQGDVDYVVIAPPAVLASSISKMIDVAQDGRTLILR